MAGTLKVVRFKRAWQSYPVGAEITPNGTLRDWLVKNGYVDVIDAPAVARTQRGSRAAMSGNQRRG